MRQTIIKLQNAITFLSSNLGLALNGEASSAQYNNPPNGYTISYAKTVMPVDGTFSLLAVHSPLGYHQNHVITLMVNGVATALSCPLSNTDTDNSDNANSVSVVAGDDIYFRITTSARVNRTTDRLALNVQFDGDAQFYSINQYNGQQAAGGAGASTYKYGGALGNGVLQGALGLFPGTLRSNTRSYCAVAGTVTGLWLKNFATAASSGGSYVMYLLVNGVLQDGSGGTVDTACTMVDGTVVASTSFSLPVAALDILEMILIRVTTASTFSFPNVSGSISFVPDDAASFMFVGGSNDANNIGTDWKWMRSLAQSTNESVAQVPVGATGFTVTGLFVEMPSGAGTGQGRTFTVRKNGVNTGATVTLIEPTRTGEIRGLSIPFVSGDLLDLQNAPYLGGQTSFSLWWSIAAEPTVEPPPPVSTCVGGGMAMLPAGGGAGCTS